MSDARAVLASFLRRPYLILTLASLQWGANTVMGRLAVGEIAPMLLVSLRWAIVAAVLLVINRRGFAADWPQLRTRLGLLLLLGLTGYTGFTALFYAAAHFTTGANMSIIQGAMPLFVFSFAFVARGRPIGGAQAVGMTLTLVGVAFVATRGNFEVARTLAFNLGDLFMVAATILYAIYAVGLEDRPAVGALSFFTAMAGVAFLTSLPLTLAEAAILPVTWPTPRGWLLTALIAIFPSFVAQIFFIRGVELIGPGRAGVFINLIPIFGAAMAVAFLGEPFGWYQGAGLALVMVGIVLAQRR
ncbi:DMT family transporter [Siculibacillus lacustris]|uniref:DMT family transporter n=1 Tax=Siculibacillus lacustris TaxID=1549641 RepID=A0A4Q9VL62_9HYPH|nr:DMT family transporter [Siculibacillus lacustris]TBW35952.1 DMT family transporter [Siculibacillus lacustris]